VQRLGASLKIRHGNRKWLHRRVSRAFLPNRILKRKKRGFGVNVVDGWFQSSVSGNLEDLLLEPGSAMFRLLRPETVRTLFEAHRSRQQDNHKLLFSLALFEQWLRALR
jgi:asparagine synthase (glutamine-hydrolysing)